ncbi:hypothetical protein ACTXT7_007904 [Hymenolepis weldensis]
MWKTTSEEPIVANIDQPLEMSHYMASLANAFFHWSLRYPTGGLLNVFFKPKEDEDIFILNSGKNIVDSLLKLLSDVLFSYPKVEYHILKSSNSNLGFSESTYLQNREGKSGSRLIKSRKKSRLHSEIIVQALGIIAVLLCFVFVEFFFVESKELTHLLGALNDNRSLLIERIKYLSSATCEMLNFGLSQGRKILNSLMIHLSRDVMTSPLKSPRSLRPSGINDFGILDDSSGRKEEINISSPPLSAISQIYSNIGNSFKDVIQSGPIYPSGTTLQNRSNEIIDTIYQHFQLLEMVTIQSEIARLIGIQIETLPRTFSKISNKMEVISNYIAGLINNERELIKYLSNECGGVETCVNLINLLNSSVSHLTSVTFQRNAVPNLIASLKTFQTQLNPWLQVVRNFNQSLSDLRVKLSNNPKSFNLKLSSSVEALWKRFETWGFKMLQRTEESSKTMIPVVDKILKISVTAIVSTVSGIFAALILTQDEFSPKKLEQAHLELLSKRMASIKSTVPQAEESIEKFNQLYQRIPEIQSMMANITVASRQYQTLDELELIAGSFLNWLEKLSKIVIQKGGANLNSKATLKELGNPSSLEAIISDLLREMFSQFDNSLTAVMKSFFTQLISCSTLHGALLELLETICGKRGLLQEIFAWEEAAEVQGSSPSARIQKLVLCLLRLNCKQTALKAQGTVCSATRDHCLRVAFLINRRKVSTMYSKRSQTEWCPRSVTSRSASLTAFHQPTVLILC